MNLELNWPTAVLSRAWLIALLVLASVIPLRSFAHTVTLCQGVSGTPSCDQGEAYVALQAMPAAHCSAHTAGAVPRSVNIVHDASGKRYTAMFGCRNAAGDNVSNDQSHYTRYGSLCTSRLDGQAGMINGTLYSGGVCDNGCKMQPNLDRDVDFSLREHGSANSISIKRGTWKATGDACFADLPDKPKPKDEYCHQTASGHTVCKSKDKTCVGTASGFRTCASDTGNQKGHTATNTGRTEAAAIGAPNTPPNAPSNRPGENWQSSGGNTSITNNVTNNVTNTGGYTNGGAPNGNNPVPGDGSGPGQGGSNGEGEGPSHGTVGGNGECTGSFTCTGGDPVLCAIAQQTYRARCEADGRFDGDAGSFPGDGDGGAGEDPDAQKAITTATPNLKMIDSGGFFGGGSCPSFEAASTKFGKFSFDETSFCEVLSIARGCLLFFGAFLSLGILMGWGSKD